MSDSSQPASDEAVTPTAAPSEPNNADAPASENTAPPTPPRAGLCASFLAWLDDRTGINGILREALYERIPGGSRWRYVWGSSLTFAFAVQLLTGIVLWMHYSPSDTTAWESVQYIENHLSGGWLLRGIHHFMAQAMVVLLALHLLQVVIDGAYKAPREINFWLGLILMQIVLGLSLTGYLLPWDQKGYWATRVATNIMGLAPFAGKSLQLLLVGGDDYNHHTVTRFFALHAGVLPGLLILFLVAHLSVFRRHGITAKVPLKRPDQYFWPDQVLKDGVACLAVMAAVLGLTIYFGGAELTAPADGAREYSAARPEWYFLFLFQFLKLFTGWGHLGEVIGAIIIPGLLVVLMFCMPFVARLKNGHRYNVGFISALLVGAGALTVMAIYDDASDPQFQNAKWLAQQEAMFAEHLALHEGVPQEGMRSRLRPAFTVLANECFKCHTYLSPEGFGYALDKPTAPNLYGYGMSAWAEGFLDAEKIVTAEYFGNTNLKKGEMVSFLKNPETGGKLTKEDIKQLAAALAAEAEGRSEGKEERLKLFGNHGCIECHNYGSERPELAPTLEGWASHKWLIGMISNPNDGEYYGHLGKDQQMPAFGKIPDNPHAKNLDAEVIRTIALWLRGEWMAESSER